MGVCLHVCVCLCVLAGEQCVDLAMLAARLERIFWWGKNENWKFNKVYFYSIFIEALYTEIFSYEEWFTSLTVLRPDFVSFVLTTNYYIWNIYFIIWVFAPLSTVCVNMPQRHVRVVSNIFYNISLFPNFMRESCNYLQGCVNSDSWKVEMNNAQYEKSVCAVVHC